MELTAQLRLASQDLHRVAERTGLMADLLGGRLSRSDYAVWLHNLQAIYAALEAGLTRHSLIPAFDWSPLYRSHAIAQDLAYLQVPSDTVMCQAALGYVARLQDLSAARSPLLLAHAYVRYLGDLHGGQLLRRSVHRLLQGDGVQGLSFYDFGTPAQAGEHIMALRMGLDSVPLDDTNQVLVANEARLGFEAHIEMFQQLPHASQVGVERTNAPV